MTEPSLPASTYAVLGLVDKVPDSSGYDLASVASISFALFWPVSRTLLYRELERLTELEWVDASPVDNPRAEQVDIPSDRRRSHSAGSMAATTSRHPRIDPQPRAASTLLRPPDVEQRHHTLLAAYRAQLQTQLDQLLTVVDKLDTISTPAARSGRIVAHHGITTTRARLEWTTDAERQLTDRDNRRRRSEAKSE